MTLSKSGLRNSLRAMMIDVGRAADDPESVWFEHGMTPAGAAALWAAALGDYAAGVVPISTTVEGATTALEAALAAAFASAPTPPATIAPALEAAFAAFATTVGAGMTGAGFTGAAPTGDVGFATLFASEPTASTLTAASALADLIHDWMTTGTATLNSPPGTVSTWA